MKRYLALCFAMMVALPARAEESAIPVIPQGYAFDQPEVLADQRLWGITHGARLLALACAQAGKGEAAEAWVAWQEREADQFQHLHVRLSRYYFQQDEASLNAISIALGLSASLSLPPDTLAPACESLAETLAQPRYDLVKRREELLLQK